ncbi:hypothetical protein Poly30_45930 [Planctomycetes bacterium Poly30]|uniref:Squalene cyclase C-terminal domain-containing protein n=1 Tax=Saltatorellus ferox TaxID=2528018 RepID=A0A518EY77_9BACT|nr:hypothetical protein Poly30_45930 [Planctomycetes bacterium Poly30]
MLFLSLALVSFAALGSPAQEGAGTANPDAREPMAVDAAIRVAALYLLGTQEHYLPDPPVGVLPEDRLADWQKKEADRLSKRQGGDDAAEWPYEGVYRVGRDRHIPSGYRVGGSAIVAQALLGAGLQGEDLVAARAAVKRSVDFVMKAIDEDPELARGPKSGYDVRGWGHAYGVQLLLLALDHGLVEGEEADEVRGAIDDLIDRLRANVTEQGGWNYATQDAVSPFMTGATLLILFDAKAHGFEVEASLIEKALDGLELGVTKQQSYAYSGRASGDVAMPGSAARSSVATLALFLAGRRTEGDLRTAIQGFFDGWDDLLVRKSQQGTHKAPYGIAPYYFFFGHTYAAFAIEALPEAERAARREELTALLQKTRAADGTWNDRIFPRTSSYSTAMSILALRAPELPPIARWESR